jgi:hypothetical protein
MDMRSVTARALECADLKIQTRKFLNNFKKNQTKERQQEEKEVWFTMLPPKSASIERRRKLFNTATELIDIVSSTKRLKRMAIEYHDDVIDALKRGVRIQIITEKPENMGTKTGQFAEFLKAGSVEKRSTLASLPVSIMIFDKKEALLCTLPWLDLGEAPILWTNNAALITVMQEYFEKMWNQTLLELAPQ